MQSQADIGNFLFLSICSARTDKRVAPLSLGVVPVTPPHILYWRKKMESILGKRYGRRIVLSKEPSALKPNGSISYARYRIQCECGREDIVSGQAVRRTKECRVCSPARKRKTHCVRGHLRSAENLIKNNCHLCMEQWNLEYPEQRRKIAREHSRRWRMQNLYNLTEEHYQELFKKQNGLCALPSCGQPATNIDHCHIRNQTRGLLCGSHNLALGKFGDGLLMLREAVEYLEKFYGEF
jgi:hypothetical protein